MELKQVIVIRADIEMGKGKMAAQAAHAALMSYLESQKIDKKTSDTWIASGEKKIVLKVDDEKALEMLFRAFQYKKVPCALVTDAGLTQLPPGSKTALGIGPWLSSEIDQITSKIKLL